MNYSKKHKRHIEYVDMYYCEAEEEIKYTKAYVFCNRRKKNRKTMRLFRKDVKSGRWQKRVYEQTGIKI